MANGLKTLRYIEQIFEENPALRMPLERSTFPRFRAEFDSLFNGFKVNVFVKNGSWKQPYGSAPIAHHGIGRIDDTLAYLTTTHDEPDGSHIRMHAGCSYGFLVPFSYQKECALYISDEGKEMSGKRAMIVLRAS